jgi:NhaP-type Na+/H+ or K+/H+ antiporter
LRLRLCWGGGAGRGGWGVGGRVGCGRAARRPPPDPVLTSSIVTNVRVPRLVRHSLNLESGLNDGLALPAVLAFAAALSADSGDFVWWRFVLQDVGLGFLYGIACGWIASLLMPRERAHEDERSPDERIPTHQRSLFALGVAFATYGVTVLSPKGNGFIAVFVAAIVLSVRRPDVREHFERNSEEIVEIVKLGIFFVFGSLLTVHAFTREGWAALAFVAVMFLVARPVAVWLALIGTRTDAATRLFMGWFGPKGVASMTFALIVLDRQIPGGVRIFDLTALVVFCSILVHGISDTPGANWIARRAERTAGGGGGAAADSDESAAQAQA